MEGAVQQAPQPGRQLALFALVDMGDIGNRER
jgi:hypothetical protein